MQVAIIEILKFDYSEALCEDLNPDIFCLIILNLAAGIIIK